MRSPINPHFPSPLEEGEDAGIRRQEKCWKLFEKYKVAALFSAHNHLYYRTQPHKNGTWQVVCGNGGSKLNEKVTDPKDQFYGFTLAEILSSGNIRVTSLGRDIPENGYLLEGNSLRTTVRDMFIIEGMKK